MKDKVAIILVNYNGKEYLNECIRSLKNISYDNYEIIVVDNKSTDDSIKLLKKEFDDVKIINAPRNGGFSYGNNIGIKEALKNGASYLLLINNDTLVEKDFLDKLIESYQTNADVGIVGPKIMYYPEKNKIWFGGGEINWLRFKVIHKHIKETDNGQCDRIKEIGFITGCAMLISAKTIEKVGYLEEEYFMYCEDIDFSMKVLKANMKIIFNPNSIIYHKVSLSSGGEDSPFSLYWKNRNMLKIMKKHKDMINPLEYAIGKCIFYAESIVKMIVYKAKGMNEHYQSIKRGLIDGRDRCGNEF